MGRQVTDLNHDGFSGRVFVLLQGPSSFFFSHLGAELQRRGARVIRVGFCPGDRLFWRKNSGTFRAFRDSLDSFGSWLSDLVTDEKATDLIMLGDGRAPHEIAIQTVQEQSLDVKTWITEHGYLRPNLILIEPDGMGGGSRIPDFPLDASGPAPVSGQWSSSFLRYAAYDVAYHMSNVVVAPFRYPNYRAHSGIHPLAEYWGWIRKFVKSPSRSASRKTAWNAIEQHQGPVFLLPLQLSHDTQLVKYGTGEAQVDILRRVLDSFGEHAPNDALLVVKVHPMDNDLTDWKELVSQFPDNIVFLDGGDLDALLRRCTGVVTVNSTVGLSALMMGVPTLALGQAVYRKAGLSSAQSLDEFWSAPAVPDANKVDAFCQLLRQRFHVAGAFDGAGVYAGANGIVDWLEDPPTPCAEGT